MATDPAARAAKALDDADLLDLPHPSTGIGLGDVAEIIRAEYAELVAAAKALRRYSSEHLYACDYCYPLRQGSRDKCSCGLDAALARFDAAAEGTE